MKAKENFSESIIAIAICVVSITITLISALTIKRWEWTASGMILCAVSFMWWLFESKIRKCSEQRNICINNAQLQYIQSGNMWNRASSLLNTSKGKKELYGVVSIKNIDDFNKKMNAFAKKIISLDLNITFKRIICFDCKNPSSQATKDWFLSMIDSQYDKKNEFQDFRNAINIGKIEYMYYPKELFADFLIIKRYDETNKKNNEMVYSIIVDKKNNNYSYVSGFYCSHEGLIDDFIKQFDFLWKESVSLFNQSIKKHEFSKYWDSDRIITI